MDLGLNNKTALVTAASGGLGFATAQELVAEGVRVAICSRDQGRAEEAAKRLRDGHEDATVLAFQADVSKEADLNEFVSQAAAGLGGLDILVCNAGGPPSGGFGALQEEDWEKAYHLTLMSVARSVRLALPHFESRGGGSVLTIVSSSVKRPIPNLLLSNVFRPAVQGLCKSLAIELAHKHIRVNCLAPGRIKTERTDALDQAASEKQGISIDDVRARSVAQIPMGRLGAPEEFGRVAAFLCSDAASYISGSTVLVDGAAVACL